MVKILESKSDFNKYFKECCKQKVPCVTIHFNRSTANIRCDYNSVDMDPPEQVIDSLIREQKMLWKKYLNALLTGSEISSYGRYTTGKIRIEIAYELTREIAKIMYRVAKVPYLEDETIEELPVAKVVSKNVHTWTVQCPYCGMNHNHGIGEGAREAHCQKIDDLKNYYVK